jgi:hypothetical protein
MCGGLLIANHLDQSFWSTNQKYWAVVRSNLLHSFLEVHNCVAAFTSHGKLHEFGGEKPIFWAKPAHFDIFVINFTVWSHTLRTSTTALYRALEILDEVHQSNPVNHWNSVGTLKLCTGFRALQEPWKSLINTIKSKIVLPISDWLDSWISLRKLLLVVPNYLQPRFQFDGWGWKKS